MSEKQPYIVGERLRIGKQYLDVYSVNGQTHIGVQWRDSNAMTAVLDAAILDAMGTQHCHTWETGDTVQMGNTGTVLTRLNSTGWSGFREMCTDEQIDRFLGDGKAKRVYLIDTPVSS